MKERKKKISLLLHAKPISTLNADHHFFPLEVLNTCYFFDVICILGMCPVPGWGDTAHFFPQLSECFLLQDDDMISDMEAPSFSRVQLMALYFHFGFFSCYFSS